MMMPLNALADLRDEVLRRRVARMTERLIERNLKRLAKQQDHPEEQGLPSPLTGSHRDQ